MEQVFLPLAVVEAINNIRESVGERTLFNYPTIVRHSINNQNYKAIAEYINLSDGHFKKYYAGLVNGFQIEWTKEEQVYQYYSRVIDHGKPNTAKHIKKVLDILEIEIAGINAGEKNE